MSLKNIKNKIRGVEKTHKVTKAMEAVSAVKMRKSQERAIGGRPYALAALSILKRVGGSQDTLVHSFLTQKEKTERVCVVVITSDKGLAGSLNSAVIRAVEVYLRDVGVVKENIGMIGVGKKGYEHFSKRGYTMLERIENLGDDVTSDELKQLTKTLTQLFSDSAYDRVMVAYSQFKSTFEQKAVLRQVLPLSLTSIEETVKDILPTAGKYAEINEEEPKQELYNIEPDAETVLNDILPRLLQIELYHSLLEAKASEHSARMVAMKNASDKARDLTKELTLSYNKARQAQITREVSEIVGGIEAMN